MSHPAVADPLEDLLRRCHRDELTTLVQVAKVDERGMGLSLLARNAARGLRRLGAHAFANAALRGGEGPPYLELLRELARQRGVDPRSLGEDVTAIEAAVLRAWFSEEWGKLGGEARKSLWDELDLPEPVPETGALAVDGVERAMGPRSSFHIAKLVSRADRPANAVMLGIFALHPVGCLLRAVLFPFMPLLVWWYFRRDDRRFLAGVLEVARLRQVVLHRLTIGVVGSPSSGKDAAIRALFGIDTGNISPVAGSTKAVAIHRLPGATAMYVVNTPGMGDVVEQVTEEARQILDHIDVFLYVVNAEGGVQARELEDYRRCVSRGRPVAVLVNKIDVLRPKDRDTYLADARAKLGCAPEDFLPVAVDPLPQLSPVPLHLDTVHRWLQARLGELGKDPSELPPLPTPVPKQVVHRDPLLDDDTL